MSRSYCRCTVVRNYDYDEAAEKLRCKPRWLQDNIRYLPHQKLGGSVAFCDCELALIQAQNTIIPPQPEAGPAVETRAAAPSLMSIRPSQGRKRAAYATS